MVQVRGALTADLGQVAASEWLRSAAADGAVLAESDAPPEAEHVYEDDPAHVRGIEPDVDTALQASAEVGAAGADAAAREGSEIAVEGQDHERHRAGSDRAGSPAPALQSAGKDRQLQQGKQERGKGEAQLKGWLLLWVNQWIQKPQKMAAASTIGTLPAVK